MARFLHRGLPLPDHRPREPRRGLRHGIIYAASRGMLVDRDGDAPRQHLRGQRYRHIVGPVRIDRVEGGVAEDAL